MSALACSLISMVCVYYDITQPPMPLCTQLSPLELPKILMWTECDPMEIFLKVIQL